MKSKSTKCQTDVRRANDLGERATASLCIWIVHWFSKTSTLCNILKKNESALVKWTNRRNLTILSYIVNGSEKLRRRDDGNFCAVLFWYMIGNIIIYVALGKGINTSWNDNSDITTISKYTASVPKNDDVFIPISGGWQKIFETSPKSRDNTN